MIHVPGMDMTDCPVTPQLEALADASRSRIVGSEPGIFGTSSQYTFRPISCYRGPVHVRLLMGWLG